MALEKGDASVALKILSCGRGLDTIQSPEGPTDPKAILRCEAYERARREFDANLVDGLLYPHEVKPLAEKYFKQLLEKARFELIKGKGNREKVSLFRNLMSQISYLGEIAAFD